MNFTRVLSTACSVESYSGCFSAQVLLLW